jgi:hypothetical protein
MDDVGEILRKRKEAKVRVDAAQRKLQDAQDRLIIAKAGAKSDLDPELAQAQKGWRDASASYSELLDEYTRLLGPI